MRRGTGIGAASALLMAFAAPRATAAEWAAKGSLDQQMVYNDNISFGSLRREAVWGYIVTPTLEISRKSRVFETLFRGQGLISRYDDSRWDCENVALALNNRYLTQRGVLALAGSYTDSCSYTQQISDTGVLAPKTTVESFRLAPSWTWKWTPRDQLIAEASYSTTSYANTRQVPGGVGFSGNETYAANLGINHLWSRNLSLNGGVFFSHVQYTSAGQSTQVAWGPQVGANYRINRRWSVSAGGGLRWVDTLDAGAGQREGTVLGHVGNLGVSYTGRLATFSAGYSNAINPSGIGQLVQSHGVYANYAYRVTARLSLSASGNFTNSQSIGNSADRFDRNYLIVSTGIVWEFAKNWRIRGEYVYRWQDYGQDRSLPNTAGGTADANTLMLSINYAWDGIRGSR